MLFRPLKNVERKKTFRQAEQAVTLLPELEDKEIFWRFRAKSLVELEKWRWCWTNNGQDDFKKPFARLIIESCHSQATIVTRSTLESISNFDMEDGD